MDRIVHVSAQLRCAAHRAFQMFTENELLQSWMANVADVEPRVGGKYELFWDPRDRENDSTLGCTITAIEPDRFLAFEWRSPRQFKHFANAADPLTHVVVFFVPIDSGTEVQVIHSGWRGAPEWEEARLWQERAWRLVMRELEKQVNAGV